MVKVGAAARNNGRTKLGCTVYRERVREIERGDWERGNDQAVAYIQYVSCD